MITRIAKSYGNDPTVALRIATCESQLTHFKNGEVLRGVINPLDVGIFQINEKYHLADSKRLGFNIYTKEGNIEYAMYLMHKQGVKPWSWSASCWR